MLQKLLIKNIALIDSAEICFTNGLNVLSGETGSGKSVIIESLNFVLGAKSDRTLIRSGEQECLVKAEFFVGDNKMIAQLYNEFDFDTDDLLIISRKFTIDGKNSIKINGNNVTASMLRKFTSALVDVHGQSEHFNLLKTSNQLALIDNFIGEDVVELKNIISQKYSQLKSIIENLNELGGDESQRLIRIDILNYQINEIEKANFEPDEEEKLLNIKQKLLYQEKIVNALNCVSASIRDEGGVEDILSGASRILSSIATLDNDYNELYTQLEDSFAQISDIANQANNLLDNFELSEYNPYEIDERLNLLKNLKNKYGSSVEEIYHFLNNAIKEKNKLENYAQKVEELEKQKQEISLQLYKIYDKLSDLRRKTAQIFCKNVLFELAELGMKNSSFEIAFNKKPSYEECSFSGNNGFDNIEFMFSANLGEPLKNLANVISGGEMSRFMLSIKAQTAKYDDISTFIFDEIDTGISGNVAKIVAEKFAKISKNKQVIAITHLPQISVMADNNLLIEKNENSTKTLTTIKQLSSDERVFEIVRLIGGDKDSKTALNHAKDLIHMADLFKKTI